MLRKRFRGAALWRLTVRIAAAACLTLPGLAYAAPASPAAAAQGNTEHSRVEPVLDVASFGMTLSGSRSGALASSPQDFLYSIGESGKKEGRTWSGPLVVDAHDGWQTLFTRLQLPQDGWVGKLMTAQFADWPRTPARGSRVWVEWLDLRREERIPIGLYYSPKPQQIVMARYIESELRVRAAKLSAQDAVAMAVTNGEFYEIADTIGLSETIVDELVNIFSGELDFHNDLKKGYKCTVLFETQFDVSQMAHPGRVLAARLVTLQKTYSAYWFDGPYGVGGYFAGDGRPVQKNFLKSPILFSRMTSGYSVSRFHPILHLWRAHTGVDFAAPAGTPARTTAAGMVEFVGSKGGYGNLVMVRHVNGMSTYYGHLQSFSKGLIVGQLLRQGDVVGAVGMTGLATGPHLHYELRKFDQPLDPVKVDTVLARLPEGQMHRFNEQLRWYDRQLAAAYRTHYVVR